MEIISALTHKNKSYLKWCILSDEEINKNKVQITVTYVALGVASQSAPTMEAPSAVYVHNWPARPALQSERCTMEGGAAGSL